MKHIIIDADCALGIHGADVDDALAILMVAGSGKVSLDAVTVVAGNVTLHEAIACTSELLRSMGISVPIGCGQPSPLCRELFTGKASLAQRVRQGGREFPLGHDRIVPWRPDQVAGLIGADALLVQTALQVPGEITLIAIGALTNVARAIQREPRFAPCLKEIIFMGGAFEVSGNRTRFAEANVATDPEAAKIVFEAGVSITMLPFDMTMLTRMTRTDWMKITAGNSWLSSLVVEGVADWLDFLERGLGRNGCKLHDLLAVAVALDPSLVRTRPARVHIQVDDSEHAGQTDVEYIQGGNHLPFDTETNVVVSFNNDQFMALVAETLRAPHALSGQWL